jgi:hypothetical protein
MIAEHVAEVFERDETGRAAIGHGYTYSATRWGRRRPSPAWPRRERLKVVDNAAARGAQLWAGFRR